jgi:hypothetical protein
VVIGTITTNASGTIIVVTEALSAASGRASIVICGALLAYDATSIAICTARK